VGRGRGHRRFRQKEAFEKITAGDFAICENQVGEKVPGGLKGGETALQATKVRDPPQKQGTAWAGEGVLAERGLRREIEGAWELLRIPMKFEKKRANSKGDLSGG